MQKASWVFDLDDQWADNPHFFKYDFNFPEQIPKDLHQQFDYIVIDPPFITREVWEKYAEATKLLLARDGKIMLTTVRENAPWLKDLLGVSPQKFRPSIPNLVYQYDLYVNYELEPLSRLNPEIPED